MVEKVVEEMMSIRAPTADVGYVANAKYFAHIPHQTPFDPIYQMCHISYFLQHATVKSQICNGTKRMWQIDLFFFLFIFLSHLSVSLTSLTPTLTALPHPRQRSLPRRRPSLSSNGFFFFFFFDVV